MHKSWGKVLRIYNLIQYPWGGFEIKSKTRVYNNIIIKSCVYVFNNFNLVLQKIDKQGSPTYGICTRIPNIVKLPQ